MINTPVVLLGLYDTGLYTAHSFARYNIPVFGFDYNRANPGFYSRHIKSIHCFHPFHEPERLLKQIIAETSSLNSKPILIPSSEEFIAFVAESRNEIQKYYNFILPEKNVIENILNKEGQFEMARKSNFNVPYYRRIETLSELKQFLVDYKNNKVILKALHQAAWKSNSIRKAYIANNYKDVLNIGNGLIEKGLGIIVQNIIEGDCTNNFEFNSLMIQGEIIESCVIQKIRQYPPDFGAASCIQTTHNPAIEEMGRNFVIRNRIEGFSNTEFKMNPDNGMYYFIETNARVWMQIRLTEWTGQNFLISYYNYFVTDKQPLPSRRKDNVIKWIDVFADFTLWWRHLRKNGLNLRKYLASLSNVRNFGLLTLNDMHPFFHAMRGIKFFKHNIKS
jgi:D-aspartate ligase